MNYMNYAVKEAYKAAKKGDVPVGAIIVMDGKIIARAHNKREKNNNAIEHAELIAISKACKKLKTWHLNNCILYSTMEPCMMCSGAIIQSRIREIHYIIDNNQFGFINNIKNINIIKEENEEYRILLKNFFKQIRNSNVSRETLE